MRDRKLYTTIYDECCYLRHQQFMCFHDGNYNVDYDSACGHRYAALIDIAQQLGLDHNKLEQDVQTEYLKFVAAVEKAQKT